MGDWHGWRGNVVCQSTKYSMIVLVHSNITFLSSWPDWKTQTWYSISWFIRVRNMRGLRVRHINSQTLYEQKWDISRMHFEIYTLNIKFISNWKKYIMHWKAFLKRVFKLSAWLMVTMSKIHIFVQTRSDVWTEHDKQFYINLFFTFPY